ncbi:MAG: SRPBCC family protein, partial [Armatimonadetes bacterium]|nr:SRPBCC family protein [Armatimonadota bacterium]
QLEGDFSEYSGRWEFTEVPAGTQVQLEVNYDYNVPLIGALIKNLLRKKMQQNTDAMLAALKEEAESAGEE